jgi:hypothetical protein
MKAYKRVSLRVRIHRFLQPALVTMSACSILCFASPAMWAATTPKVSDPSATQANGAAARTPVLVELFTSEGCSSCPPADALLSRLDATQFVPGAQAIVLSEHVTYWNHLGWSDPFSLEEMTQRQSRYASRFGLDSVYTPQAIVDGEAQVLGSDSEALGHAIAAAAMKAKAERHGQLTIEGAHWSGSTISFAVKPPDGLEGVLTVVLAEDATQSSVGRGENAGRTLHHVAVVRRMQTVGASKADEQRVTLEVGNLKGLIAHAFRLIAFMTDEPGGRVLAVAEVPINRP